MTTPSCQSCPDDYQDLREGKYPWRLMTEIVDDQPAPTREEKP